MRCTVKNGVKNRFLDSLNRCYNCTTVKKNVNKTAVLNRISFIISSRGIISHSKCDNLWEECKVNHLFLIQSMHLLSKKNLSFSVVAVVILITVVFQLLPRERQHKIWKQLSYPYQALYMSMVNLEEILQPHRETMKRFYNNGVHHGPEAYIAHGGGIGEMVHTNSQEALDDSIARGFRYVELDLLVTEDEDIIGAHSWRKFANLTENKNTLRFRKKTLQELQKLKINGKSNILNSEDIRQTMKSNPGLILVTDKIDDFELLLQKIPYPKRMIVEVFSSYDYIRALKTGIQYPAYRVSSEYALNELEKYEFPIAVISASIICKNNNELRIKRLHQKGITFFVHHGEICDTPAFIETHLGKNISAIYTDKWYPSGPSPFVKNPHDNNSTH